MTVPQDPTRDAPDRHASDPDVVDARRTGTRSFVYGAKTLAAAVVVLALALGTDGVLLPAFWVLAACGALGLAFSAIESSTTRGVEVISQRRVNLDVVATVVLALLVAVVWRVASG